MPTAAQVQAEVDRVLANPRATQREIIAVMALVLAQQAAALKILAVKLKQRVAVAGPRRSRATTRRRLSGQPPS